MIVTIVMYHGNCYDKIKIGLGTNVDQKFNLDVGV